MARNITPPGGKPAPGARLAVDFTAIGAGGNAVARHNGLALLVPRGVPGERAEVVVEKVYPRYATARRELVLAPAPGGADPRCPHFEACRGCDWQHVAYATQLEYKRQVLEDQLARIGGLAPPGEWEITPCAQPYEYRDKVEFSLARREGRPVPGLHGPPGAKPVPIERCHLAPAEFSALATAALDFLGKTEGTAPGLPARLTVQGTAVQGTTVQGTAAPAEVTGTAATGGGGLALTLHYPEPPGWMGEPPARAALCAHLAGKFPTLATVALAVGGRKGRRAPALELLKGGPRLTKAVAGRPYLVPLLQFFQVNPTQAARMVEAVSEAFQAGLPPPADGRPPLVMELFCGVGLFSLPLAEAGFRVAGVEKQPESVRAARESARAMELNRCVFQAADLGRPDALPGLLSRHGKPAGILLNPPRAGLPPALAQALLKISPERLLYVSCDGGTLARDAKRLAPRYQLTALRGFDLFPQTHHLEVLATFTPRRGA